MMSFNYFDDQKKYEMRKDILPKTQKYFIEIKALGLRDLKSFGFMPVQRAFIKFDFNSIKAFDKDSIMSDDDNITTLPKENGPNPNISSIINFGI